MAGNTFSPVSQFSRVAIPPNGWATIQEFADWFMAAGAPLMIPWNAEVIVSDDATAVSVFRFGRYQVELYLIHPAMAIPEHSHPGMESLVVHLGGGELGQPTVHGVSNVWGTHGVQTKADETHGGRSIGFSAKGYVMLTFQIWPPGVPVTSAAIHWKGDTAGPKQDALIKRNNPHALIHPGSADVTRKPPDAIL